MCVASVSEWSGFEVRLSEGQGKRGETGETCETGENFDLFRCLIPGLKANRIEIQ